MPRVHNPRGTRLERFHRWVADWFRGKPGWIGANTRERKMTRGDADAERHKLWCVGRLAPGEHSPLLAQGQILAEIDKMMGAWRNHNSEGTDMCGLSPRAVFVQCSPPSGFPRISEDELAYATAQHFDGKRIAPGGIIELPDGIRYSHPLLIPLAGQTREVVRMRHDYSFITVLPVRKGEEPIVACRRAHVGMKDPDQLAAQMELRGRVLTIAGEVTKAADYDPGSRYPSADLQPNGSETPAATADFAGSIELSSVREREIPPLHELEPFDGTVEYLGPLGTEIGSVEFLMERERYKKRVKPLDFADLEK
jgi:hypothetical protein